jgi:hypothetical protein
MNTESTETRLSDQVAEHLHKAMHDVVNWMDQLNPEYVALLENEDIQRDIVRFNYMDGYWRIKQTTPLILSILKRLNDQQNMQALRFWSTHLSEELGHDLIMHKDLVEIFGSDNTVNEELAKNPITAPSAAIIGYYQWQVDNNNPHLLIILRFFLESYFESIDDAEEVGLQATLGTDAIKTLSTHREADQEHVQACFDYVDDYFTEKDLPEIVWSINLIATCLLESQIMIANRICAQHS